MFKLFQPDSSLYLPDPVPAKVSAGFFLPGAENPASLTLADSWEKQKGYYFFLLNAIDSTDTDTLKALEAQLKAAPELQQPAHTGVCWWQNVDDSTGLQAVIHTIVTEPAVVVKMNANIGFGTYQFPLFQDAPLVLQAEGALKAGYPVVNGAQASTAEKGITITITGEMAGVVSGQAMVNDFSSGMQTGLSVGFRYNMFDLISGNQISQFYPLFAPSETYYLFDIHWDPLHPLDSKRSYLAFTGISFGLEKIADTIDQFRIVPSEGQPMASYFRTIYGQPVSLQPVTAGPDPAQFVFQTYADPNRSPAYYMVPKGTFILETALTKQNVYQLLPGLAGTECIQFTPGDAIVFYPDNAAYAASGVNSEGLDTTYTCSWAFIKLASGHMPVTYSVSPGVASMYQSTATPNLLDAYYVNTAQLPAEAATGQCFPMVPYAGITGQQANAFAADTIAPFEKVLIAPARKAVMSSLPTPQQTNDGAGPVVTTTPQGLLATINGAEWEEVVLAHNTEIRQELSFRNLPIPLRNAFQTDNLFLVISDNKNVGAFNNALVMEGWQFNINIPARNPAQDPDKRNILLLKFRKGAMSDLINDTNTWTYALEFNYDTDQITAIQTWLIDYFNEAIAQADKPEYANFANLIQDPDWYGILALKVDIDLGNFPKDLHGLLGAMDLNRFNAHHVGIKLNFVQQEIADNNTSLRIKKSNMFGLINYVDPSYQQQHQGGGNNDDGLQLSVGQNNSLEDATYVYKVLFLQIIFENTVITNFDSQLQLTARKWFEEDASLNVPKQDHQKANDSSDEPQEDPANYSMIFNGHYENHDGHQTYTFLTQKTLTYQYFIKSELLNYIEFVKAQFQTITTVPSGKSPDLEAVTAKFTFYGYLNFRQLPDFDGFSYGAEKGKELEHMQGLYFSNLALDVAFELNTKSNKTDGLRIVLDPGNTNFDQSMSTVRNNSFAAAFPVSPNAILQGTKDKDPKKLQYQPVVLPVNFISAGLQDVWYAINFDVHWGGPGALASRTGFIPQLMLAWSPGSGVSAAIFLRLPGSGGGNTFSIQNVLKLSAGPFQLKQVAHDNSISYNLFLINLSLGLFGLKLPLSGNVNLALLGDQDQPGSLGWYCAYINQ